MRERQNAKSLGAVHTHTHTHTHTQILIQWKNLAIQRCYVNKADLLDSLEREQCLVETWLGFAAKEGKKEQEKGKFREGSLSKVASKKINQKQKENEYKWEKRVDCI